MTKDNYWKPNKKGNYFAVVKGEIDRLPWGINKPWGNRNGFDPKNTKDMAWARTQISYDRRLIAKFGGDKRRPDMKKVNAHRSYDFTSSQPNGRKTQDQFMGTQQQKKGEKYRNENVVKPNGNTYHERNGTSDPAHGMKTHAKHYRDAYVSAWKHTNKATIDKAKEINAILLHNAWSKELEKFILSNDQAKMEQIHSSENEDEKWEAPEKLYWKVRRLIHTLLVDKPLVVAWIALPLIPNATTYGFNVDYTKISTTGYIKTAQYQPYAPSSDLICTHFRSDIATMDVEAEVKRVKDQQHKAENKEKSRAAFEIAKDTYDIQESQKTQTEDERLESLLQKVQHYVRGPDQKILAEKLRTIKGNTDNSGFSTPTSSNTANNQSLAATPYAEDTTMEKSKKGRDGDTLLSGGEGSNKRVGRDGVTEPERETTQARSSTYLKSLEAVYANTSRFGS